MSKNNGRLVFNAPAPNGSIILVIEYDYYFKIFELQKDGTRIERDHTHKFHADKQTMIQNAIYSAKFWGQFDFFDETTWTENYTP